MRRIALLIFILAVVVISAHAQASAPSAQAVPTKAQAPTPAPSNPEVDRLTASAEQGNAAAQFKLGMHYYNGEGRREPPDYAEALKWFHLAADLGNADAEDRIGMMYWAGKGVPRDAAEAARWYQLAAEGGNKHAQLQLEEMYQGGMGVPRDEQESKKWSRMLNAGHRDTTTVIRVLFACALLVLVGFAIALAALQRNALAGSRRLVVAILVHVFGIALVANSLVTYGFGIVFPHCSHNFLATACTQISDPQTRKIVNEIGDWAVVNLIWRFMAGVGLLLDGLAVWYLVYLCRLVFRRGPRPAPSGVVTKGQSGPGTRLAPGR